MYFNCIYQPLLLSNIICCPLFLLISCPFIAIIVISFVSVLMGVGLSSVV